MHKRKLVFQLFELVIYSVSHTLPLRKSYSLTKQSRTSVTEETSETSDTQEHDGSSDTTRNTRYAKYHCAITGTAK